MHEKKALIIEDSASLVYILQKFLIDMSYQCEFSYNGREGLRRSIINNVDLILLDITLPDINGQEILRQVRKIDKKKPIIIISNDTSIENEINSYRNGATIFHKKPISFELLKAQILNLSQDKHIENPYFLKNYQIDNRSRVVIKNGKSISLTPQEMSLLKLLIKNKGYACSREHILTALDTHERNKKSNSVDTIVCRIRKKLTENKKTGIIKSINGIGYKISEPPIKI